MSDTVQIILKAVADLNRQRSPSDHLELSGETPIVGPHSKLDSLGLINLIVAVEQHVAQDLAVDIVLTEEDTLARSDTLLATVASMADHVDELIREHRADGNAR